MIILILVIAYIIWCWFRHKKDMREMAELLRPDRTPED